MILLWILIFQPTNGGAAQIFPTPFDTPIECAVYCNMDDSMKACLCGPHFFWKT